MAERSIEQVVDELHALLEGAEDLEDASRDALREAADAIRAALDSEQGQPDSALQGLRDRIERFEGSHPRLTEAVRRLVDQLSEMGI